MTTVYDFEARQIDGKTVPLSRFKGQVLLIVNTASACGFTPQFGGLEELHKTYGQKGLAVLGCWLLTALIRRIGWLRPLFGLKPRGPRQCPSPARPALPAG
ncbi:MAG: hypothetical protein EOO25_17405, partial [Comamonadaceae bacterium]